MERHEPEPRPMSKVDFDRVVTENYGSLLAQVKNGRKRLGPIQKADAEDILHDMLTRLSDAYEEIDASKSPMQWIRNALTFEIRTFRRREKARQTHVNIDDVVASENTAALEDKRRNVVMLPNNQDHRSDLEHDLDKSLDGLQHERLFRDHLKGLEWLELQTKYSMTRMEVRWALELTRHHLARRLACYERTTPA